MGIRTFIAVDLDSSLKGKVVDLQSRLEKSTDYVLKLVEPENLHITLKFLGDVNEGRLEKVFYTVKETLSGINSFRIMLRGVGAFPSIRRPEVIWIGLGEGAENLIKIMTALETSLARIGFPREKREPVPHLTIARVKKPSKNGISSFLESLADMEIGFMEVSDVKVKSSTLTPSGPIYKDLKVIPLV
ncbi:MAG: RNA 2',3'-cyclic phosphodiesterase [Candidatus Methanodesulfokora sp.]|jgi:2'-5' RNA ligase|nr:MAG: RNA 2',3'-cyclic phosphodiesterase [Candidatus Korarchaeota archaeon]